MSDDDEVLESGDSGENMGTIILMLGLYLIVLAFFILLNAISQSSQDRHDLVVESVREGFDFREEGDNVGSDDTQITMIPLYQASTQEIEGVIQAYLAMDDVEIERSTERLFVSMNIRRFFRPGSVHLIPEMILFFEDLAAVLKTPQPGIGVITEVVVRGNETELADDKKMSSLEMAGRRSALFARALVDEGVFKQNVSAGALDDEPRVIMVFNLFVADYQKAVTEAKRLKDVLSSKEAQPPADNKPAEENAPAAEPQPMEKGAENGG